MYDKLLISFVINYEEEAYPLTHGDRHLEDDACATYTSALYDQVSGIFSTSTREARFMGVGF